MSLTRALTRDCRDTLFLLATIAAVVLPHADHLPLWTTALSTAILGWRAWLAWRAKPLPGRWALVGVLLVGASLTWLTHRTLLGREAGITMLAVLMSLKTLELRARRDAFVVFFLGFFLVLTQFLYSQSLLMGLWMLLSVWALLSSVVLAQMPVGQPSLALAARLALRTTALGLPVMVLLFLLFPRIAPLWGIPAETLGRTGLSDQMAFGALSEIASDDSIALRLRFGADHQGAPPPPEARYFRGPVLSHFDGRAVEVVQRPLERARFGVLDLHRVPGTLFVAGCGQAGLEELDVHRFVTGRHGSSRLIGKFCRDRRRDGDSVRGMRILRRSSRKLLIEGFLISTRVCLGSNRI